MTWKCEICSRSDESRGPTFTSAWAYFWHLAAHDPGSLARAVEPSLFGTPKINQAQPKFPRVWDRWDRGGRSGRVRRIT
jgi:hypothetical protein